MHSFSFVVVSLLAILCSAGVPCTKTGTPAVCVSDVWKPCGFYTASNCGAGVWNNCRIPVESNSLCSSDNQKFHRGDVFYVQFDDGAAGTCREIRVVAGESWGTNPINSGNYNCQGRCGPGCGSWTCSNWGRDCLKHDVCSWYHGSSGGSGDANCGDEYDQAYNDWQTNCVFGDACELYNPTQSSTCSPSVGFNVGTC